MSARPCALLRWNRTAWRPCGRPEQATGLAYAHPLCARCRRELARLEAAGLAHRARFADGNDTANANSDHSANADDTANAESANGVAHTSAQTALPLPPEPPPPWRPWERLRQRGVMR